MFHGISHIDLQAVNLNETRKFWTDVVGFSVKSEGEGFVEIDSGNVAIRLKIGRAHV